MMLRFLAPPTSSMIVLKGWRSRTKVLEEEQFKYSCRRLLRCVNLVIISLFLSFFVALLFLLSTYPIPFEIYNPRGGNLENILLVTICAGDGICWVRFWSIAELQVHDCATAKINDDHRNSILKIDDPFY